MRNKIRATVRDQAVAELLAPKNHPIGTKRICVDTDYYQTYQPRERHAGRCAGSAPITAITPNGVRTGDAEYALDSIVFATGFDAMTGALLGSTSAAATGDAAAEMGGRAAHLSRHR